MTRGLAASRLACEEADSLRATSGPRLGGGGETWQGLGACPHESDPDFKTILAFLTQNVSPRIDRLHGWSQELWGALRGRYQAHQSHSTAEIGTQQRHEIGGASVGGRNNGQACKVGASAGDGTGCHSPGRKRLARRLGFAIAGDWRHSRA